MVATLPHNEDRFAQPLMMTIAGKPTRFETKSALFRAIRGIEADAIAHNLRHARAVFHLGQAINEAAEKLGYGSKNHLYNECGIHKRRAQKAIRFAQMLAGDDGQFCTEKYRQYQLKALANTDAKGRPRCKVDAEGHPSVRAIEQAMDIRSQTETKSEPRVAFDEGAQSAGSDARVGSGSAYKPMSQILGEGSHFPGHQAFTRTGPAGVPDSAAQLQLEFDLDAAGDTLATTAHRAAQLQREQAITIDQAAQVNRVLEDARHAIDHIIDHTIKPAGS